MNRFPSAPIGFFSTSLLFLSYFASSRTSLAKRSTCASALRDLAYAIMIPLPLASHASTLIDCLFSPMSMMMTSSKPDDGSHAAQSTLYFVARLIRSYTLCIRHSRDVKYAPTITSGCLPSFLVCVCVRSLRERERSSNQERVVPQTVLAVPAIP